jgi:hypothetical protein
MSNFLNAASIALLVVVTGCASVVPGRVIGPGKAAFDFHAPPPCARDEAALTRDDVEVRYLASGGVALRWKGDVILIGPFFTNPSLREALFGRVRWDEARIDTGLAQVDLSHVRAVLAGHSHYDHIGDVPRVMERLPNSVTIHVNDAGVALLKAYPQLDVRSIERMTSPREITPNIQYRAFRSGHAPQVCLAGSHLCYNYADRKVVPASDLAWEHRRLRDLSVGRPHAFFIELMDGTSIRYRIYYNDAAADVADIELPAEASVDLALLCAPGWNFVSEYPNLLLAKLKPKHVVVTHYEDFFTKWHRTWRFVAVLSTASVERFLTIVNGMVTTPAPPTNPVCGPSNLNWTMPVPGSRMVFKAH